MFHYYLYNLLKAFSTQHSPLSLGVSLARACFSAPLLCALSLFLSILLFFPRKSFPPGSHYVAVMYMCMRAHTHTHTLIYTHTHTHIHTHSHTHTHTHTHT